MSTIGPIPPAPEVAAALRRLFAGETDAVILEGSHNAFVQFGRVQPGTRIVPFEAVSDRYLDTPFQLNAAQKEDLRQRGFEPPLPTSHPAVDVNPNWAQLVAEDEWEIDALAQFAIDTLCSVYGVSPDEVRLEVVESEPGP